jgi:hypothetical protein
MSNPRVRRRLQKHRSNPLPMNNQEKDLNFLSKLSQNDTLQRFRRKQQLNTPVEHHQQPSSSDEQDVSPTRPSHDPVSQPVIIQKPIRASSVKSNIDSSRPPLHSAVTKSLDPNQVNIKLF